MNKHDTIEALKGETRYSEIEKILDIYTMEKDQEYNIQVVKNEDLDDSVEILQSKLEGYQEYDFLIDAWTDNINDSLFNPKSNMTDHIKLTEFLKGTH